MAEPNANSPKPILMSMRTGGSGTGAAEPLVPLVSVVAALRGAVIGAPSELWCRLENASAVVGRDKSVRRTNRQPYTNMFMVFSLPSKPTSCFDDFPISAARNPWATL